MRALFIFALINTYATSITMDTPLKKELDPKTWQHMPSDISDKILLTHITDTFTSPEYTPNIVCHIQIMRSVCKKYRKFIQKRQTMEFIFKQLSQHNKDIQAILQNGAESTFIHVVRMHDVPAINLSLLYNHVPKRFSLLLEHWDLTDPTRYLTLDSILEDNLFREKELTNAVTQAKRNRQTKLTELLIKHGASIEKISFIGELKPECRQPEQVQHVSQIITDNFSKHILLTVQSPIYNCKIPITTALLLCLSIGNPIVTKKLLESGIDACIKHNDVSPLTCNICQKHDKCVALLLEHITPNIGHLIYAIDSKNIFTVRLILTKNKKLSDPQIKPVLMFAIDMPFKEAVQPLLEYIKKIEVKLEVFDIVKQMMKEHQKTIKIRPFKKNKRPIFTIFTIFCDHLGISYTKALQDINREIKSLHG